MIKQTLFDTGVQTFGKIVTALLGLLGVKILVLKLGLSEYGIFTVLSSAYLIFDVLADFGTKMIGVREMAVSKDRSSLLGKILVLRLFLVGLVLILGIGFVYINPLLIEHREVAIFALSMVILTSLAGYVEMMCMVKQKLLIKSFGEILFSGFFFAWIWGVGKIGLMEVYMAYVVARIVSLFFVWCLIFKSEEIKFENIKIVELKKILSLALPMGLYGLLFTAYDRSVDTWALGYFWNKDVVGVYGVAYKVYINLVLPAYFFMNSVFPRLSLDPNKKNVVAKTVPWLFFGSIALIFFVWMISSTLMFFMIPQAFLEATSLLRVLSIALVFSYLNHLFGYFVISVNKQKELLKLGLVGLFFNLFANLVFIPIYGSMAAAVVTILTEACMTLGLLYFFFKK